jgi:SPP1 gp7 family putative phage head morphogenesis protein
MSEPLQGRLLREWFDDMGSAQMKAISVSIRMGVLQGSAIPKIARQVRDIGEMGKRHANTVVRTAVAAITDKARLETYKENSDIIKGELFVATLDGRTTPLCASLDQTQWPVGEGPRPPLHPNCRSVRIPLTKSWRQLGFAGMDDDEPLGARPFVADTRSVGDIPKSERDQLIGDVPSRTSFQEWLEDQPIEFVYEYLGPTKAALFLDGGLDLPRFVDVPTRHEWTLDELRKREPAAFKRAGL